MKSKITIIEISLSIFVVLKLIGIIDWPWWLVLVPLWVGLGLGILLGIIGLVIENKKEEIK